MNELVSILEDIRDQLAHLNDRIDSLTGCGCHNISDIVEAMESIKGVGYDLSDVCSRLDSIDSSLSSIDTTIMMK